MGIVAAILAGGRARRMGGAPKALLEVGGRRIVDRQVAVLGPLVDEVLLVVGDAAPYGDVRGVRLVVDRVPGQGPLGGMQAAFGATAAAQLLLVGCDLPFLDAALCTALRDARPDAEAVVPRAGGRPQPLCARYARRVQPLVEARLAAGHRRLLDLVAALDVAWLDLPPGGALTNVNTPEDLLAARSR